MRITKLHLLLLAITAVFAVVFYNQYRQEQAKQEAVLEARRKAAEEAQARARMEFERKKASAAGAIAAAGGYWTKGRQEGRNVSAGQLTLHMAKESMGFNKFEEAEKLARQSIEELKAAPLIAVEHVEYKVKRGDNLWKIAKMKRHYGRGSMWPVIWRANEKKIPDFDVLRIRLVLTIPKSASEIKKFTRHKKI